MKKCEYCAKEITYHEQYCCEECEKKSLDFYSMREKYTKLFSAFDIIGVFLIPIGIFLSSFKPQLGTIVIAVGLMILGLTVFALPFPVENMITSMKIKKATKVTRIFGAGCFFAGLIVLIVSFLFF